MCQQGDQGRIKKYQETNECITQNLWETMKEDLRGNIIAIEVYLKMIEKS